MSSQILYNYLARYKHIHESSQFHNNSHAVMHSIHLVEICIFPWQMKNTQKKNERRWSLFWKQLSNSFPYNQQQATEGFCLMWADSKSKVGREKYFLVDHRILSLIELTFSFMCPGESLSLNTNSRAYYLREGLQINIRVS